MSLSEPLADDALPGVSEDEYTLKLPQESPCFAWLVVLDGPRRGRLFRLKADGVTVGRAEENDIVIDDQTTSRHHARLFADDDAEKPQFFVQDLASANGTFVNGERVARHPLKDDDRIIFGEAQFAFKQR